MDDIYAFRLVEEFEWLRSFDKDLASGPSLICRHYETIPAAPLMTPSSWSCKGQAFLELWALLDGQ